MPEQGTVGVWDQGLFDRFRAATGERKRQLLSELLHINGPLVKKLTSQITGVSPDDVPLPPSTRRNAGAAKLVLRAQCAGIPWEDLFTTGLEGMAGALERFDSRKGKIAGFARWRILYAIQEMLKREHGIKRTEKGKPPEERIRYSYVDSYEEVERALEYDSGGVVSLDGTGISPEHLAEWNRTGDWPETMEEARRRCYSIPARPIDSFLAARCTARPHFRSTVWDLYVAFARHQGEAIPMPEWNRARFERELVSRGYEAKSKRVREHPDRPWLKETRVERGIAGLSLVH